MRPPAARRARAALVPAALCLAALATLGFPGCPENPTGSGGDVNPNSLTMSNCWPNDDGRYWNYEAFSRFTRPEQLIYSPPGQQVPEVTTELAKQLLRKPMLHVLGVPAKYHFGIQFRGRLTSDSGVEGQNLLESFAWPVSIRPSIASSRFGRDLLERLAQARPDLRAHIAAMGVVVAPKSNRLRPEGLVPMPSFIHGNVWVKGTSWIGTYSDWDTILTWKFLESNVRPGHSFRHRLYPWLPEGPWLLCEVDRRVRVELPGGRTTSTAIEVIYVIDYGVSEATDETGSPVGSFRQFDYGRVTYAPGIGPVVDLERRDAFRGQNVTVGEAELRLDLLSTGVNPPPALVAAEKR